MREAMDSHSSLEASSASGLVSLSQASLGRTSWSFAPQFPWGVLLAKLTLGKISQSPIGFGR